MVTQYSSVLFLTRDIPGFLLTLNRKINALVIGFCVSYCCKQFYAEKFHNSLNFQILPMVTQYSSVLLSYPGYANFSIYFHLRNHCFGDAIMCWLQLFPGLSQVFCTSINCHQSLITVPCCLPGILTRLWMQNFKHHDIMCYRFISPANFGHLTQEI